MIGFTVPLIAALAVEGLLGLLLLGPPARLPARLAVTLCRASYTKQGSTITFTVAGVLAVLLLNPAYDGWRLWHTRPEEEKAHDLALSELSTVLSAVLLLTTLGGLFFIRKLGAVVGACERMGLSERALLRQVQGLQSEYSRLVDSGAGATATSPGAELAGLRRQLEAAREERTAAEARAAAAERAQRSAQADLSALKTQSKGLENEYDRLLAVNEELQKRLQRAGLAEGPTAGGMGKKDD